MAYDTGHIEDAAGCVVFSAATRPRGYWARLRGLLGQAALSDDQAWWFERCAAVHTLGMRFAIDIVHLDRAGQVLRIRANTRPASMSWARRGCCVIETGAGAAARAKLEIGQTLRFVA